jgi:hypothetical protein
MTNSFDTRRAEGLISNLFDDPEQFTRRGLANDLLKEFLRGYPIKNLIALLRNEHIKIIRNAIWIASELPEASGVLLQDAARLAKHSDRRIRYFSLDVIMLATSKEHQEVFSEIVKCLDDPDSVISERAAWLISRATDNQLIAAKKVLDRREPRSPFATGIDELLGVLSRGPARAEAMLKSQSALDRRLGLVAAGRYRNEFPSLLALAADSEDTWVREVANIFSEK